MQISDLCRSEASSLRPFGPEVDDGFGPGKMRRLIDAPLASGGLSINTDADLRSVSVGRSSAAPETDRPTDPPPSVEAARYEAIEAAITPASEKVQDPVTPKIVKAIDRKLSGAPVENLVARIKVRWSAITSLAFVRDHLADDVGKVYREAERKAKARVTPTITPEEFVAAVLHDYRAAGKEMQADMRQIYRDIEFPE